MKKLLLGLILLLSVQLHAQEQFAKSYNSMVSMKKYVKSEWTSVDLTVVFNENGKKNIKFYYSGGKVMKFHQISDVYEDKTTAGEGYQSIECIDQDGDKVILQLFNDDTCLRVLICPGTFVEFHND
jgi:hypothetical protein